MSVNNNWVWKVVRQWCNAAVWLRARRFASPNPLLRKIKPMKKLETEKGKRGRGAEGQWSVSKGEGRSPSPLFSFSPFPLFRAVILGLALVIMAGCTGTTGCAGKGRLDTKTGVYDAQAEADPIVVAAEDTRAIALEVFDAFLKFERENEAKLKTVSPAIHVAAERIRADGKKWLQDVTALKLAYQGNRTAENKANLTTALAVLRESLTLAQGYITIKP